MTKLLQLKPFYGQTSATKTFLWPNFCNQDLFSVYGPQNQDFIKSHIFPKKKTKKKHRFQNDNSQKILENCESLAKISSMEKMRVPLFKRHRTVKLVCLHFAANCVFLDVNKSTI